MNIEQCQHTSAVWCVQVRARHGHVHGGGCAEGPVPSLTSWPVRGSGERWREQDVSLGNCLSLPFPSNSSAVQRPHRFLSGHGNGPACHPSLQHLFQTRESFRCAPRNPGQPQVSYEVIHQIPDPQRCRTKGLSFTFGMAQGRGSGQSLCVWPAQRSWRIRFTAAVFTFSSTGASGLHVLG